MSAAGSDTFAGAVPIAVGDTSDPTNALGFTLESGERLPAGYEETDIAYSAWWYIEPTTSGWIRADTQSSTTTYASGGGPDTYLTVWIDWGSGKGLFQIAADDDNGTGNTSLLNFYAYAGKRYYFQVTHWVYDDILTLNYVLKLAVGSGTTIPPTPTVPADLNWFATAAPIAVGDTTATVDATYFDIEPGEQMPIGYSSLYRSGWWYLEPTADGWVKVDTDLSPAGGDPVVAVWADVDGELEFIDSDDDSGSAPSGRSSMLNFYAYTGFRYYIQVLNYNRFQDYPMAHSYVLRMAVGTGTVIPPPPGTPPPPPPANDDRVDALPILVGASETVDATSATMEVDELYPGGYYYLKRSVWWYLDATADGWVTADTDLSYSAAYLDTIIGVWVESAPGVMRCLTYNDDWYDEPTDTDHDTSRLTFYAYAGTRYWFQVASFSNVADETKSMIYTLRLEANPSTAHPPARPDAPQPTNDHIANAEVIAHGSTATARASSNATTETGESYYGNRSVWFTYTATTTGKIGLDTLLTPTVGDDPYQQSRTVIYVFTGSSLGALTYVGGGENNFGMANNGLTAVEVSVTAGTTYRVRVASAPDSLDLDYVLRIGEPYHTALPWQEPPSGVVRVWQGGVHTAPLPPGSTYSGNLDNYQGNFELHPAFGHPMVTEQAGANECTWKHSRRYQVGGFAYWSNDNSAGGSLPGTCPPLRTDSPRSEANYGDDPVGYRCSVNTSGSPPGGFGRYVEFYCYGVVQRMGLHAMVADLQNDPPDATATAAAQAYVAELTAAGYTDIRLTWQSDTEFVPELLSVEVAADEGTLNGVVGLPVPVEWYAQRTEVEPTLAGRARWGPFIVESGSPVGSSYASYFTGDSDGPESWRDRSDVQHVQTYNGGANSWEPMDQQLFDDVWAWEEARPFPKQTAGLTFVALPPNAFLDSVPTEVAPDNPAVSGTKLAYRSLQRMSLRTVSTPRQYQVTAIPPRNRVDLVMKQTSIHIVDDAIDTPGGLMRAAGEIPTTADQELVLTASWVKRYAEDLKPYGTGVAQGVLTRDATGEPLLGGPGNERSLIGFDTSELPDDAYIVEVRLKTRWTRWLYPQGVGSLMLGWHSHETPPATWSVGVGDDQLSEHDIKTQDVDLSLSWLAGQTAGNFHGLAIGPGWNHGGLYAGSTSAEAAEWQLTVRYRVDT